MRELTYISTTSLSNLSATGEQMVCKAWAKFDGTGTPAMQANHNFSSIADQAVGKFRLTFTSAMSDTNYVAVMTTRANSRLMAENSDASRNAAYVDVSTVKSWDASHLDVDINSVLIFGS